MDTGVKVMCRGKIGGADDVVAHDGGPSPHLPVGGGHGMASDQLITLTLSRFWVRVDRRSDSECWNWRGQLDTAHGYGNIKVDGQLWKAHRLSYLIATGQCPEFVLHSCDNRRCVNPGHLRAGTAFENNMDCVKRGRHTGINKTHCKNGHQFTPETTRVRHRVRKDGSISISRGCVTCGHAGNRNWWRTNGLPHTVQRHYRLHTEAVREARALFAAGGATKVQLAEKYGVSTATIEHMIAGRTWSHVK